MSNPSAPLSRRALGALALAAVGATVSCARDTSAVADPPTPTLVTMDVSGGYAGVDRGITVAEDGFCTVRDRDETRSRPRVGQEQLTRLRGLLEDADLAGRPPRSIDPHLRDGFRYRLRYHGRTVVTDLSGDNRPLQDAVHLLEGLMTSR
jgi:hypothetical protein